LRGFVFAALRAGWWLLLELLVFGHARRDLKTLTTRFALKFVNGHLSSPSWLPK
jgi:hypothetical protein